MIVGYSKLFSDIIHSTVWREAMHVKVVWITMLAMADRHGQVMSSIPGLADSAKVTLEQCLDALEIFKSPDEYSRTKDYEGRRIIDIDGGWLILNYDKFRARKDDEEQRQRTKERVRRYRERQKEATGVVTETVTVTPSNPIAEADTESDTDTKKKEMLNASQPVTEIFESWKTTLDHPKAKLDKTRKRIIEKALSLYPVETLKKVFVGVLRSDWHMGRNGSTRQYHDLGLLLRDAEKIDYFLELCPESESGAGCEVCRNSEYRERMSLRPGEVFDIGSQKVVRCECNETY